MMNKIFTGILIGVGVSFLGCSKSNLLPVGNPAQRLLAYGPSLKLQAVALDVGINDPNIKYFGRWDFSNTNQYISYWGGAYLKVKFSGTTVKLKAGNTSNFYAKIDNGPWVTFAAAGGTINLTPTPLAPGIHSLSVAQGKDYDYVFDFQGLVLDAGATTSAPAVGADLIEYIGDSITSGFTDAQANVSDYAWVCSEALNAEHTQIAYPGIALVDGYGVNTVKTGMEVQYFKLQSLAYQNSPNWDFTRYIPNMVIINLGQNDFGSGVSDAVFQSHYISFLANVRSKFPNAEILVLRTFSGVKATPTLAAVNARIAAGDNKLVYIDTNGWLSSGDYNDGLHPSVAGHIKAANLLKPYISAYLTNGSGVFFDHCDALTGWSSGNTLTVNTSDKKEGTAALQSTGTSTAEFQKIFTPVNTGATAVNGSIDFWYYVSDATLLGANNQIELGSGGTSDVSEYNWNIGSLTNGWNHIVKSIASAGITGGTPNLNAVNWFRIYHAKTGVVTTRLDALRINH